MSRAQLLDRARCLALRASLRASLRPLAGPSAGGCARFTLRLTLPLSMAAPVPASMPAAVSISVPAAAGVIELIAHVRRLARRRAGAHRAKVSLPPARNTRQTGLF